MSTKVIRISDNEPDTSASNKPKPKSEKLNFNDKFRKHLALIMLDTRESIPVIDNWDLVGQFGMVCTRIPNQTRRYKIFCNSHDGLTKGWVISRDTLRPKAVFDAVKNTLKNENWISENEIELPLSPESKRIAMEENNDAENYLIEIVYKAVATENRKLIQYIIQLHRDYVNNKK